MTNCSLTFKIQFSKKRQSLENSVLEGILKMKWLLNKQSFRHIFENWRRVSSCYNSMLKIQTDLIIMQIVCSSTPFFAQANSPYLTIILPRLFSWKHSTKPTSDNKSFINNKISLILGAVYKCDHQSMEVSSHQVKST